MSIFEEIFDDPSTTPDEKAGLIIGAMTGAAALAGAAPFVVGWPLFATAVGTGVVAIGRAYGHRLDEEGAWKLIRQFFYAAGFTFLGLAVGSKLLAAILTATGGGYLIAAPLDAAVSSAIAYAVGKCGQAYFNGEREKDKIRDTFREAFTKKKTEEMGKKPGSGPDLEPA